MQALALTVVMEALVCFAIALISVSGPKLTRKTAPAESCAWNSPRMQTYDEGRESEA